MQRAGALWRTDLIERAWIGSVVGYSVLRFVVAWAAFGDHGASAWVFGVIDIGTAWPYAKAVALICRYCANAEWHKLAPAVTVAFVSFLAPYAYLWLAADQMPAQIRGGLVLFVVVIAVSITVGLVRKVRSLKASIEEPATVDEPAHEPVLVAGSPPTVTSREFVIDLTDPPVPSERLIVGCHDDPGIVPARIMQAQVYRDRGFLNESQRFDDFGALVDDWSRHSIHFALYRGDTAVGHARVIAPGDLGIPMRTYFDLDIDVPDRWEWSAYAVSPDAPKGTSRILERHVISFLAFNDIRQFVMVCEPAMLRLLQRVSGADSVTRLGRDHQIWGSVLGPMLFDIDRSDPRRRDYFSSSEAARVAISDVLSRVPTRQATV